MKTHKIETVLSLERSRSVSEGELPSQLKKTKDQSEPNLYPLRGTVLFCEDLFERAVLLEVWKVLQ
jgi:hypothetical protein